MPIQMEQDRGFVHAWNGACPGCAAEGTQAQKFRRCPSCGTHWAPARRQYEYDDHYPESRAHGDAAIAACKVTTLADWCLHLGTSLAGRRVLEIGFGGGATLAWMQAQGAKVHGVEPVEANRTAARKSGIPADRLAARIEDAKGGPFDLTFHLDSFEHEIEPDAHLTALNRLTRPGTRALVVLPVADCLSRRLMGRFWPHDIADHWVFYSTLGLTRLWDRHGWNLATTFHPRKYISGLTIARHLQHKTGLPVPAAALRSTAVWLNFGERGLIFERR